MCCMRLAWNTGRKNRHMGTIAQFCRTESSQLRRVSTMGKNFKQQYLLHLSPQYGELRPTSGWDRFGSLGTPANFNGFRILASNRALHDVWPSPGLLHYIYMYIFGGSPWRNFAACKLHFASKSCVLLYWHRYCTALQQRGQPNCVVWYKEWNYGTLAEGATYIRLGGHHVGHRPTF